MRRTLPLLVTATMLFAACSSNDDTTDNSVDTESTDADTDSLPDGTDATDPGSASTVPPPTNPAKPEVEIPAEVPDELQITVLEEGTGPEAQDGDTVVVDYVGVRTSDGVEFDNSYDRFQPFPVVLGQGGVIAGWDQGLVGAQAGSRIQLDIPSELAYGAESRGEIIGENEPLTFLIDVRAVVPPGEEPTESGVDPSEGATEVTVVDLVEGEGPELETGQLAFIRFVLFRGDNGVVLQSNWAEQLQPLPLGEDIFPPLFEGLQGMQVGGRRAITFPPQYPEFGFGPEGNPTGGLPAETDVTLVVDLVGFYDDPAAG
jgi:FKBP-type peptidyl-prolyl cis-trans isomerase